MYKFEYKDPTTGVKTVVEFVPAYLDDTLDHLRDFLMATGYSWLSGGQLEYIRYGDLEETEENEE